jgi:hypothetical protein
VRDSVGDIRNRQAGGVHLMGNRTIRVGTGRHQCLETLGSISTCQERTRPVGPQPLQQHAVLGGQADEGAARLKQPTVAIIA